METEQDFLERRLTQERAAAANAADPQARRVHEELAQRYEQRRQGSNSNA